MTSMTVRDYFIHEKNWKKQEYRYRSGWNFNIDDSRFSVRMFRK